MPEAITDGCKDHPTIPADAALVRRVPIFASLTDGLIEQLTEVGKLSQAAPRTVLFSEGEVPEALHILIDGCVTLSAMATDGRQAVTELIQPIRHFALATVLARLPYVASAETIAVSALLTIPAQTLHDLMHSSSDLANSLMRAQALDYMAMVREVSELKLRTAAERLADYLLELAQGQSDDAVQLRLPIDKQILAARLGCRQENLSRAFAILRKFGVETHGRRVTLHSVEELRKFTLPGNLSDPEPA